MGPRQDAHWWARITHAFQAHVREESYFLEQYEALAEDVDDPGTRFLIDLILEDEKHHHELFNRLAEAARGDGNRLPPRPAPSPEVVEKILEATERFLEAERDDRVKLKDLAKELKGAETGHWHMLVELTDLDTRKHVVILEYLLRELQAHAGR